MSWKTRAPFGPIKLSADAFEEIEPVVIDGVSYRRVRLKGTDKIGTEVKFELYEVGTVTPKPMDIPEGGIFYMETKFPGLENE